MDKLCIVCKTIFHVKPSHFEKRMCCSKKCQSESFKTKMLGDANPNFKNKSIKTFTCITCNKEFQFKTYGQKKTCSKECYLKNILNIHTGKIIFNKRKKTDLTNLKLLCKCGNNKDYKSKTCLNCFKSKIKRPDKKCIVCENTFTPKTSRGKTCSKKCLIIHYKNQRKQDKNSNWKGGVGSKNQLERRSDNFKKWRIQVFERDKYTCKDCNKIGGTLHAHHILPFATNKELRFDINNGKTLCFKCHKTYHPSMNFKSK
jgi:predicted nucleic acid-binding Zn ribbon protein